MLPRPSAPGSAPPEPVDQATSAARGRSTTSSPDAADWNAPTRELEPAELPQLVRTFEILFAHVPQVFAIEVLWGGDRVKEEWTVSREAMLDAVQQGKPGTRTRYRIAPASA